MVYWNKVMFPSYRKLTSDSWQHILTFAFCRFTFDSL
jgi:hypothetical protein